MNNVPKLRFKEFSGEWKEYELGEVVEISKSKYNPNKSNETYKCIELEHIAQSDGKILGYVDSKEQNSIKNKFKLGEVLFGKLRPYLKKYWLADFEGACSSEIWVLNGKGISNKFLYRLVQSDKFNSIASVSAGSKMPRADWNYMSIVPFNIPVIEEQEKIANFLTKVDSLIEKQSEKVTSLEQYKKGMMQKIFSKEIRFKKDDGEEFGEWEEVTFADILIEDLYPIAKPKERYQKLSVRSHAKGTFSSWIDKPEEVAMDTLYEVKENQLIISITFAWEHAIAIVRKEDENKLVSHRFPTYKFKENAYFKFYTHYIKQPIIKYKLGLSSPGGAGRNRVLNKKEFLNSSIILPSLEEQTKIASFLSNIDSIVEKEKEKLEELRKWKKGLLQGMFV